MKCAEVRDILSGMMDGLEEPQAIAAMQHAEGCPECAKWRAEVEAAHVTMHAAKLTIPGVDFSGSIMANLPSRHPASHRATPAFSRRKLVLMMAACWLLGAVMMAGGIGFWAHHNGGSPHVVAAAKVSAGAAGSVARPIWQTGAVLFSLALSPIVHAVAKSAGGVVTFLIIDTLVLLLAAIVWRKRRTVVGPFCLLS